jgi:alpha-D-xyloside xylohydrolase
MNNLNDFDISNIFNEKNKTGIGRVRKIMENEGKYEFEVDDNIVKIKDYGKKGIKVTLVGNDELRGLDVEHNEPSNYKMDSKFSIQFPKIGERFQLKIKKGDETIFEPYASGEQLGFINLGDEFYELFAINKDKDLTTISFKIPSDYPLYGLGENFTTFNKRGKTLITFPHDNYCLGASQVYKGVPFLLSNAGIGIVFPEYAPIMFDMGTTMEGLILITVPKKNVSFYILLGTPKEIVSTFMEMFGKPEIPPEWSFGLWVSRWAGIGYKDLNEVSDVINNFKKYEIPVDVISMDPQWIENYIGGITQACSFKWDRSHFKNDHELGDFLHNIGKRLCLWINPYIEINGPLYEEMKNCLLRNNSGQIALVPNQDKNPMKPLRGMVDFNRKDCSDKFTELVANLMRRSNADAVMTDFGETVPIDAVDSQGNLGYLIRNKMGDLYQESAFIGVKRANGKGMVWGRSGSILAHNFPIQWGGDSNSTWEGLKTSIRAVLSSSLSGTVFSSFDTGGFAGKPDKVLYIRWVAAGAFMSHLKLHGTTPREPWNYDDVTISAFKELISLRYRLLPYIIEEANRSLNEGVPLIRPLVMEYPEDKTSMYIDDEYMLGSFVLVAPILSDTNVRDIYLPPGEWIYFYDNSHYEGKQWIKKEETISHIPLFVKKGAEIEMVKGSANNVEEFLKMQRVVKRF